MEKPSEYILALERRKAFSRWLSETAAGRIEEEVSLSRHGNHVEAVFSCLTGKRIGEACRLAQKSGKVLKSLSFLGGGGREANEENLNFES